MTYDPSKLTFAFLSKPVVRMDGTHVSIRAYYNEGVPGMEESKEIPLVLGTDEPGAIVVAACDNAHAWAESLSGNISTREVDVGLIGKTMLASASLAREAVRAHKESEMKPVFIDEDDI